MSDPSETPELDGSAYPEDDGLEVVDFADPDIYMDMGISPARWERAKMAVDVRDLIRDLFGLTGNTISCPFHGRDSKPSFNIYPKKNDCFCWGCGEVDGYWDTIKIVDRHHGWGDRARAVQWLESHYPMPPLPEGDHFRPPDITFFTEDDEAPEPVTEELMQRVNVESLIEPFIQEAARQVEAVRGTTDAVDIVYELVERLFSAVKQQNPIPLACVVGSARVRQMIQRPV